MSFLRVDFRWVGVALFLSVPVGATNLKKADPALYGRIQTHITCFDKFDKKRADKLKAMRAGGKLCHREPKDHKDESAGQYSPRNKTTTLIPHNISVGTEHDNPAFEKVVVYEETQHSDQDWSAYERWEQMDECMKTPATTDTSADASTHNAVAFAATIEEEMNEVAAQIEQLCKRNDLCGKLTIDNKDDWKNCIKDIKEYLKQNMKGCPDRDRRSRGLARPGFDQGQGLSHGDLQ